jgi:DNA-binding NarL/FixJ family response regulator
MNPTSRLPPGDNQSVKTALIVEDLPDIRHWLSQTAQLAYPHLAICSTAHVHEALQQVRTQSFDLALVDLGLPDGNGVQVLTALRDAQPQTVSVVVTIHDDDDHLFPALQAGAFGYLLKDQPQDLLVAQLIRITQGEPPLSPAIARRVLAYFSQAQQRRQQQIKVLEDQIALSERENDVLLRVSKGFTLIEIAKQLGISRHTVADHVKQIYRKLGVSSRAEAALEAVRRGIVNT